MEKKHLLLNCNPIPKKVSRGKEPATKIKKKDEKTGKKEKRKETAEKTKTATETRAPGKKDPRTNDRHTPQKQEKTARNQFPLPHPQVPGNGDDGGRGGAAPIAGGSDHVE